MDRTWAGLAKARTDKEEAGERVAEVGNVSCVGNGSRSLVALMACLVRSWFALC